MMEARPAQRQAWRKSKAHRLIYAEFGSISQFCKVFRLHYSHIAGALRNPNRCWGKTGWIQAARDIAICLGESPENLWPGYAPHIPGDDIYSQTPEELVLQKLAGEAVRKALQRIQPTRALVLRLRYFNGLTLEEIGIRQGRSRERVRQVEQHGLRLIRHPKTIWKTSSACFGRAKPKFMKHCFPYPLAIPREDMLLRKWEARRRHLKNELERTRVLATCNDHHPTI